MGIADRTHAVLFKHFGRGPAYRNTGQIARPVPFEIRRDTRVTGCAPIGLPPLCQREADRTYTCAICLLPAVNKLGGDWRSNGISSTGRSYSCDQGGGTEECFYHTSCVTACAGFAKSHLVQPCFADGACRSDQGWSHWGSIKRFCDRR